MAEKRTTQKTTKAEKPTEKLSFNPYPGLRPFKIEESHLFFGREGQTDEVLQKLSQHRFVGIIGPSGSGKSSFVYCGVLPILYGGFLTNTGPNWDVIILGFANKSGVFFEKCLREIFNGRGSRAQNDHIPIRTGIC